MLYNPAKVKAKSSAQCLQEADEVTFSKLKLLTEYHKFIRRSQRGENRGRPITVLSLGLSSE